MGLRKATDAEVLKHFMFDDALKAAQAEAGGLDRLRDQMGLVMDLDEVHPNYRQCGVCKSKEIKYYPGGYQDPGTYGCLVCRSTYDEYYPERGWHKPALDGEVWDALRAAELIGQELKYVRFTESITKLLGRFRRPAGTTCSDCKTPMPNDEGSYKHCVACEIKWNRAEIEKRHGT
jgi:hypothetical protein